jgi:hypothetical protein
MVRENLRQRFISALESLGGSAGNGKLQAELEWQDHTYWNVHAALIEDKTIAKGRGRGGSVSLAASSDNAATPKAVAAPPPTRNSGRNGGSMFEQTFKNIDDVLWKEAGCTTELDYTEQTSWILFLKYLDDLEQSRAMEAELVGKPYTRIIDKAHSWSKWAAPRKADGSFDHDNALTGEQRDKKPLPKRLFAARCPGAGGRAALPVTEGEARAFPSVRTRAALLRKGIAKNNDVLFAHNATVGPVAILKTDQPNVILGTTLTYYRCNRSRIIPEYLAHYMRSFAFKKQYLQIMRQSTRNQVPITQQREFLHVIPPISEQAVIVKQLDVVFESSAHLDAIYTTKLNSLAELKQSVLQKVFSGELAAQPEKALPEAAE